MDDILLNKFASMERCIKRIREEYAKCDGDIERDILRQDSIVLNIERACEQCINMGQRLIREKKLGMPKEYREIFTVLRERDIISKELSDDLKKMVGFRNLAIHEYRELNLEQLKYIIEHRVEQLLAFGRILIGLK
ncbi:MAG: DUF86 domain-containing protein [Gammaproteobacteria bacterium]|nr:DUF86 domain-containing protein [Gammaproteobacteria bacterium]